MEPVVEEESQSAPAKLEEFERLDSLLSQIPKKAQQGILKTCDLVLTCIAANVKYIALGTNVGLTFVYCRADSSVQRLKAKNANSVITSLSLHDGVDNLVATGTASGDVTVFCLPGAVSINKKQIQKFDVHDVHHHFVTCLVWSTNGMKLFSGDKSGQVVVTDVDFYQGVSKSECLLIEASTEIVQMDYLHKLLLVSTRQRTFVVRLDRNSELIQIGSKERKIQGSFGACFIPTLCKPEDVTLYAARPGCRVWLGNVCGSVKNTHMFGDPLSSDSVPEIPLLTSGRLQTQQEAFQFGKLLWLSISDGALVTWSNTALVVLDPFNNRCLARQSRLSGVVDVAVVPQAGEIFLLRRHGDVRVIRIATAPEIKARAQSLSAVSSPSPVTLTSSQDTPISAEPIKDHKEESAAVSFFRKLRFPLVTSEKKTSDEENKKSNISYGEESKVATNDIDLPPVVRLGSPELESLQVHLDNDDPKEGEDIVKPTPSTKTFQPESKLVPEKPDETPATSDIGGDIVFAHRMKKKKRKTHDATVHQKASLEPDRVSQQSSELSTPPTMDTTDGIQDENSTLEALKAADEILSHMNSLFSKTINPEANATKKSDTCEELMNIESMGELDNSLSQSGQKDSSQINQKQNAVASSKNLSCQFQDTVSPDQLDTVCGNIIASSDAVEIHCTQKAEIRGEGIAQEKHVFSSQEGVNSETISANFPHTTLNTGTVCYPIDMIPSHTTDNSNDCCHETKHSFAQNEDESKLKLSLQKLNCSLSEVDQHMSSYDSNRVELEQSPINDSNIASSQTINKQTDTQVPAKQNVSETMDHAFARVFEVKSCVTHTGIADINMVKDGEHIKDDDDELVTAAKNKFVNQQSFLDIYSDMESIEASNPFGRSRNSVSDDNVNLSDDFYSIYLDSIGSSHDSDNLTTPHLSSSDPARGNTQLPEITKSSKDDLNLSSDDEDFHALSKVANSWSEFVAPANIYSLAVSDHHVWLTDKSENIYYSTLREAKGIVWRKATGYATQISVSPSGCIVWRLHRGVVHAGTKISVRHPEGLKWVEAVRDVQYISVYDNCAWFIKRTGEVMVQAGLSKERPCYRSRQVDCGPYTLKQVTVGGRGVVWGISEGLQLLVRTGVTDDLTAGEAWEVWIRESPPYLFSHVAIDNQNVGWAIDVSGEIWFCPGVTQENPKGDGSWWQVPMSGYVVQNETTLDMIRSMARKFEPSKLPYILSSHRSGLISAGSQGVWLARDFRNLLQVCRGTLQGFTWREAQPAGMSSQSYWLRVCASISHLDWGLIWAVHVDSSIFAFKVAHSEASSIIDCDNITCVAASQSAIWVLSCDGAVKIRTGMTRDCPLGSGWVALDLAQLGDAQFVHISCNSSYVWAVEMDGGVYQRIGSGPPTESNLNPVWLPIESFNADLVFTKVFVGPLHWMVWGIDNRRLFYVRVGITDIMPIGKEWMHIPGLHGMDMTITRSGVWALTPQGEIYFRYGITQDRPAGDYWRRIPGIMHSISASGRDDLWGINMDGQLLECNFKLLHQQVSSSSSEAFATQRKLSRDLSNDDWEIV